MIPHAELEALRHVSAAIGADPLLIQAAGGNTSVKADGVLWVKASGKWLARALDEDIFVALDLALLRQQLADGHEKPETGAVLSTNGLRPSIETSFHGWIDHPVVMHVHSVNTLALAIRTDGRTIAAERLAGLNWRYVPYATPGLPLTRAMMDAAPADTEVLVLANHGLVVAGATVAAVEALLREVERRLALSERPAPAPDLAALEREAASRNLVLPADTRLHALATDPVSLQHALRGPVCPDQVVYLGPGFGEKWPDCPYQVLPGVGVLERAEITSGQQAMVLGLSLCMSRVPGDAGITTLDLDEVGRLLNWDAEIYRKQLDAKH